jgi:hypothetical protein
MRFVANRTLYMIMHTVTVPRNTMGPSRKSDHGRLWMKLELETKTTLSAGMHRNASQSWRARRGFLGNLPRSEIASIKAHSSRIPRADPINPASRRFSQIKTPDTRSEYKTRCWSETPTVTRTPFRSVAV